MRKAWIVAASVGSLMAMVAGAGFLARAGRFRLPTLSLPGLAILAAAIGWVAWRARRGRSWARRLEAGILLVWGSYLLATPTLFDGWSHLLTRAAGAILSCWGGWLLVGLVRDQIRDDAS